MTVAVIDTHELSVTPIFKFAEIENIPKSEAEGRPVMEVREVVEIRMAGNKNFIPVVPVDAFWKREGLSVITYAERWPEQYKKFKEGNPQEAAGTPLEMLSTYGVTPSQISLCRALSIYSIEALNSLEGQAVKNLGMQANALKEAARAFLADRGAGKAALDEMEALRRRIAELEMQQPGFSSDNPMTKADQDAEQAQRDAIVEAASAPGFESMTDDQLRDYIEKKTGARPHHRTGRDNLLNMAQGV